MIAQVERIVERGSLPPPQVKIPGILADCAVVAEKPEYHQQTFAEPYSAAFDGEIRVPMGQLAPMVMGERKLIARRAALELQPNAVANLGIGMPEGVAEVAAEEHMTVLVTLTAEPMGLRERLLETPLDHRLACDADSHALFINFERLQVRTPQDVDEIQPHIHESSDEALKHMTRAHTADNAADQAPGG